MAKKHFRALNKPTTGLSIATLYPGFEIECIAHRNDGYEQQKKKKHRHRHRQSANITNRNFYRRPRDVGTKQNNEQQQQNEGKSGKKNK